MCGRVGVKLQDFDPDHPDERRLPFVALHAALFERNAEVVSLLLENGANASLATTSGQVCHPWTHPSIFSLSSPNPFASLS